MPSKRARPTPAVETAAVQAQMLFQRPLLPNHRVTSVYLSHQVDPNALSAASYQRIATDSPWSLSLLMKDKLYASRQLCIAPASIEWACSGRLAIAGPELNTWRFDLLRSTRFGPVFSRFREINEYSLEYDCFRTEAATDDSNHLEGLPASGIDGIALRINEGFKTVTWVPCEYADVEPDNRSALIVETVHGNWLLLSRYRRSFDSDHAALSGVAETDDAVRNRWVPVQSITACVRDYLTKSLYTNNHLIITDRRAQDVLLDMVGYAWMSKSDSVNSPVFVLVSRIGCAFFLSITPPSNVSSSRALFQVVRHEDLGIRDVTCVASCAAATLPSTFPSITVFAVGSASGRCIVLVARGKQSNEQCEIISSDNADLRIACGEPLVAVQLQHVASLSSDFRQIFCLCLLSQSQFALSRIAVLCSENDSLLRTEIAHSSTVHSRYGSQQFSCCHFIPMPPMAFDAGGGSIIFGTHMGQLFNFTYRLDEQAIALAASDDFNTHSLITEFTESSSILALRASRNGALLAVTSTPRLGAVPHSHISQSDFYMHIFTLTNPRRLLPRLLSMPSTARSVSNVFDCIVAWCNKPALLYEVVTMLESFTPSAKADDADGINHFICQLSRFFLHAKMKYIKQQYDVSPIDTDALDAYVRDTQARSNSGLHCMLINYLFEVVCSVAARLTAMNSDVESPSLLFDAARQLPPFSTLSTTADQQSPRVFQSLYNILSLLSRLTPERFQPNSTSSSSHALLLVEKVLWRTIRASVGGADRPPPAWLTETFEIGLAASSFDAANSNNRFSSEKYVNIVNLVLHHRFALCMLTMLPIDDTSNKNYCQCEHCKCYALVEFCGASCYFCDGKFSHCP